MNIYLNKVHAQRAHDHDKIKKSGRVAMKQMVQHRCYMYQNTPGQDNLHSHMTSVMALIQTTTAPLTLLIQMKAAAATPAEKKNIVRD